MTYTTGINYADSSWGPWRGCQAVSAECAHCYAKLDMERKMGVDFEVVVRASKATFEAPLRWKDPRRIFVCPWGDFWHEDADVWREGAFDIMRKAPRHTYLIVSKRWDRPVKDRTLLPDDYVQLAQSIWMIATAGVQPSVEQRQPLLRELPARTYGLSAAPLLEGLTLLQAPFPDWLVIEGESGPNARPMHPYWVKSLIYQAARKNCAVWFKQWGEWLPWYDSFQPQGKLFGVLNHEGDWFPGSDTRTFDSDVLMVRVGKRAAGHIFLGETWQFLPDWEG